METFPESTFEMSPGIAKLAEALAGAQSKMGNALKDAKNPHFNSAFATLASVREACGEHFSAAGIAVLQPVVTRADGTVGVRTMLAHSSGEWIASTAWCRPEKAGPQALGSVISYLRRYSLAAVAGIAQEDDDGNAGNGKGKPPSGEPPKAPAKRAPEAVKPAAAPVPTGPSASKSSNGPNLVDLQNLALDPAPKGLGWAKPHALSWLKKYFGVQASVDLTVLQIVDAHKLLTVLQEDGEDEYRALLGELQDKGRVRTPEEEAA